MHCDQTCDFWRILNWRLRVVSPNWLRFFFSFMVSFYSGLLGGSEVKSDFPVTACTSQLHSFAYYSIVENAKITLFYLQLCDTGIFGLSRSVWNISCIFGLIRTIRYVSKGYFLVPDSSLLLCWLHSFTDGTEESHLITDNKQTDTWLCQNRLRLNDSWHEQKRYLTGRFQQLVWRKKAKRFRAIQANFLFLPSTCFLKKFINRKSKYWRNSLRLKIFQKLFNL